MEIVRSIAALLTSIAGLLTWQWLILILAISFRRPLRGLIERITHFGFGGEKGARVEFAAELERRAGEVEEVKKEDRVAAKLFVLCDAEGKERAKLGVTDTNSTSLSLYDPSGKERASIFVLADGTSSLAFYDADGKQRATLATGLMSGFQLIGPDGTSAATLFLDGTERPDWEMVDPRGLWIT
jgi:hypothetical protein